MGSASRRRRLGLSMLAVVVLVASVLSSPMAVIDRVQALIGDPVTLAVAVAALYLVRPFVAWPLSIVTAFVGYGYGFPLGIPIGLVGATISCLPPFLIARYVRTEVGFLGRIARSGERFFDATGDFRGVAAGRLAPAPADAISYGAGISGVSTTTYAFGTFVGEIPWVAGLVFVGASMREFTAENASVDGTRFVLAALVLAALVLAGPTYRYVRDRRKHEPVTDGGED